MKFFLGLGLILMVVVFGLQVSTVSASTTDFWGFKVNGWQKYSQPVLPRQSGQWDSGLTREISPIINDTDGKMARGINGLLTAYYYGSSTAGISQIGRATSSDNGYTWSNRTIAIAPSGVNGSWYKTQISQPSVIKRVSDGKLFLFANGHETNYSDARIGAFSSTDEGSTWTDEGVQVTKNMFHFENNGAAVTEFGVPRVIKLSNGNYLMVLEGQQYGQNNWRIFAATSSSPTSGWTAMNGGEPILLPGTATWENIGVANPQIIEIESGAFILAYNGRGTDTLGAWRVGFASSTNLTTWYRNPGNPAIGPGNQTFDAGFVETSFLAKEDSYGVPKLYFQAYDANGSPQVGLATADWREFTGSWFTNNGFLYARRSDSTLMRTDPLAATPKTYWNPVGYDWNQFSIIFGGRNGDNHNYVIRESDGALLRNYFDGSSWSGWVQIGSGWDQFNIVFMGTDGWIYAVRNDGAFLRNFYNGSNWSGWVQIGSGWDQFEEVFPAANTDTWIYAKTIDGFLLRNKYVNGTGWLGWETIY